jgi:MOSC domain-containing protein YiiM
VAIEPTSSGVIELKSVNVGTPREIGLHRGKPVISAIFKEPVTAKSVYLDWLNLEGDYQADQIHHGGSDKAVFAYSSDHFQDWTDDLGSDPPFVPTAFGENLTVAGWTEDDVRIGDVWAWGDALLQIAQPRIPCYKLGIRTSRPHILKRFTQTGRTGWYLRVLKPGEVPVAGPIQLHERHPANVTVRDAHLARLPGDRSTEDRQRVLAVDALAEGWREMVRDLIEREAIATETR